MKKLLQNLIKRLVVWIYDLVEEEKTRRDLIKLFEKIEAQRKITETIEFQRKREIDQQLAAVAERQRRCAHLKGGKVQNRYSQPDYAVTQHTFADDHVEVRCMICGKKWNKENKNLGEGLALMDMSTNTPSSSERVFESRDRQEPGQILLSQESVRRDNEDRKSPWWPFATTGYVKYWEKMRKKFERKKKNGRNRIPQ